MAVSREGKMNEKRLWKGKSWYPWRKLSQETGMPPGSPVSFIVCQSPRISLLWTPQTMALFGLYPRPWLVNRKVPYFPWKISCLTKLEGLSEAQFRGSATSKTQIIIIWMGRGVDWGQDWKQSPGVDLQLEQRGPISALAVWTLLQHCHESALSSAFPVPVA